MGDESMKEPNGLVNEDMTADIASSTAIAQDAPLESPIKQPAQSLTNGDHNQNEAAISTENQAQPDRSDSEAETVVSPSKKQTEGQKETKTIKLEDVASDSDGSHGGNSPHVAKRQGSTGHRSNGLKRKRGEEQPRRTDMKDEQNSSELSSNGSSPAPRAHSSKTSDSGSDNSRSPSPAEDDDLATGLPHPQGPGSDRKKSKRRTANIKDTKQHKARRHDRLTPGEHSQRSESPQNGSRTRTKSSLSNGLAHGPGKRRRPAPLNVDRRKRTLNDADVNPESDDDSSVQGYPHTQRVPSGDGHALSPMKVSHKKNIDRSGRTLLARACANQNTTEEAQRWLKERPQDINIPDYAGNTPLQIASLQGSDEIVQLLLDANCDTTCKNLDGDTPLIDAVENCHAGVVKLLLKAGVDPRQRNKKGQEPVELVNSEDEDCEEIRTSLTEAKMSCDAARRQSEDHRRNTRDGNTPSAHASATTPSETTRSPPPVAEVASRKRSARSQQSEGALLWISPTPQRLREEAGKGNLTHVNYILGMRPQVETEAVIAAVKGGHYDVVSCMMAMGKMDVDPSPLRSGDQQAGQNTPMLAAIGRGNLDIIQLLLDKPQFNPTQRLHKQLTYAELAEERRGERWQEERDMLQNAIDEYIATDGRKSNGSSPRRYRKKNPNKVKEEDSESPQESRKIRKPGSQIKELEPEQKRQPTYQGTAAKQRRSIERDGAASATDRANSRSTSGSKPKLDRPRSAGNDTLHGPQRPDFKPRRKLMSGNDLRIGQDARRRAKSGDLEDGPPANEQTKPSRRLSSSGHSARDSPIGEPGGNKIKASSEEPSRSGDEPKRKRTRNSASPDLKKSELKKRPKIDIKGAEQNGAKSSGSASSTHKSLTNTLGMSSPGQGAAPVAFMGAQTASPTTISSPAEYPTSRANADTIDQVMPDAPSNDDLSNATQTHNAPESVSDREAADKTATIDDEAEIAKEAARQQELQQERKESERRERKRLEDEAAQLDAKRRADEIERQAQLLRQAEEARLAKIKRDEEMHRRRQEEEKQRHEEQERRRREREERDAVRRLKRQEDERRAMMEALPNGLRKGLELGPEGSKDAKQIQRWLPLRTATTKDLESGHNGEGADDQWIANIQAAPLLANQDLDLSQFTALTRHPATLDQITFLWRQLRVPMSISDPHEPSTPSRHVELELETRPKFVKLKVFWIKLVDFLDIVPRHPHLNGIRLLPTRPMALMNPLASGLTPRYTQSPVDMGGRGPPMVNGNTPNGDTWGT